MFSITETINSRSDDIEVTPAWVWLPNANTDFASKFTVDTETGTDIKSRHSLSQFSQSHHSAHALPHVRGTEKPTEVSQAI